jgi:hypothetical protein
MKTLLAAVLLAGRAAAIIPEDSAPHAAPGAAAPAASTAPVAAPAPEPAPAKPSLDISPLPIAPLPAPPAPEAPAPAKKPDAAMIREDRKEIRESLEEEKRALKELQTQEAGAAAAVKTVPSMTPAEKEAALSQLRADYAAKRAESARRFKAGRDANRADIDSRERKSGGSVR